MKINLSKESKKFLASRTRKDAKKLNDAIDGLIQGSGNTMKLVTGKNNNKFRLKIEHYRIIYDKDINQINILFIDTKTNMKFTKYGYH